MVINLSELYDKSGGTHWVSLYFNFSKDQIYFFDSVANKPGKRILIFIKKLKELMENRKNNSIVYRY
jgi:Ulp1 family protease